MTPLRSILTTALAGIRRRRSAERTFRKANKLYQSGSFPEAVAAYREVLTVTPHRPVALFNLGLALYKSGEKAAGREQWKLVLELTDGKNAYLHEQAEIMLRQFG